MASTAFFGTYAPRMDDKGRVTLPAKYREHLAAGVMLTRGQDHAIYLFTKEDFDAFAQPAYNADVTNREQLGFQRYLFANSEEQRPDAQGRITMSARMRDYAGIDKDVVINGSGSRMEIWAADAWERYEAEQETAYAAPERGLFGSG